MNRCIELYLLFTTLGIVSMCAQTDSLKIHLSDVEPELILNPEAVKSIDFGLGKPKISTPGSLKLIDSKALTLELLLKSSPERKKHLTLRPYTIYTKINENPIYDKMKEYYISPAATQRMTQVSSQPIRELKVDIRSGKWYQGGSAGVGVSHSFSMEDLLRSIFWKGRDNSKTANAWKTY